MVTAHAAETNSTTTANASTSNTLDQSNGSDNPVPWGMGGMMMGDQGFGGGPRDCGPGFMGMRSIEISTGYNQTVTDILNNDTDVANLISQGYNVTSIRPIITNVVGADGTVTTQATTAIVTLQNGTTGFATVNVDVEQAKVTHIVILTRTVIDKTNS